jgi:uncharacterized membrane protein YqjE
MQAASPQTAPLDARPGMPPSEDTSLSTLLGGIVSDVQQLMEDHLKLLKLEMQDDLQKSKNAMIPMAIGAGLMLAACMLMMVLLIGWLAWLVPEIPWYGWAGLLAIGIACIGGILLLVASQKWQLVQPLPEKTLRLVKRTIQSINNQVNTDKT